MSPWNEICANMEDFIDMQKWSDRRTDPLLVPWPQPGNPAAILRFELQQTWLTFLSKCSVAPPVPLIVSAKFRRAQKLYALAWFEYDLIKAGELIALTALELALKDQYGHQFRHRSPAFHALLRHMVERDGLTDGKLPFVQKYGGSVLLSLYETDDARCKRTANCAQPQTTLVGIRNSLAHGDPFDGLPWSGLLELVCDLINYAYRDLIAATGSSNNLAAQRRSSSTQGTDYAGS